MSALAHRAEALAETKPPGLVLVSGQGGSPDSPGEAGAGSTAGENRVGAEEARRRPRVLVADDEVGMRLLLSVNLGLAGFEVIEASNGADAMARIDETTFDLLVLDVMMPDVSGHDVVRTLNLRGAPIPPFVFLSARAAQEDQRLGFDLGAVDYITKPFDPLGIADHLALLLDRVRNGSAEEVGHEQRQSMHPRGPSL
jgi:DNA-binding response OmpR family regulator